MRFSPVSSPVVVALLDGDRGEDPDRRLALAHAAVEREEGAEAGDVGGGDAAGVALARRSATGCAGCSARGRWWRGRGSSAASRRWSAARGRPARCARGRPGGARRARLRSGGRRFRWRGIVGAPGVGWPAPGARADPPPPARPPGRAILGWRVGPRAGGAATRRRRGPRPGSSSTASAVGASRALGFALRGLGLVVGAVGALDGLLELGQRGGDVRAGELAQRLGGEVLVRAPAGGGHPLAGGHDEAGGVLLGGDHDERAAVELAGGLGAVDELPQPRDRGLRVAVVAVVDAQPAAAAVLARLGDVGAQLVDDEPDAAGGDAGDALAGLRVGRACRGRRRAARRRRTARRRCRPGRRRRGCA